MRVPLRGDGTSCSFAWFMLGLRPKPGVDRGGWNPGLCCDLWVKRSGTAEHGYGIPAHSSSPDSIDMSGAGLYSTFTAFHWTAHTDLPCFYVDSLLKNISWYGMDGIASVSTRLVMVHLP